VIFHIKNFKDLQHAVAEYITRDYIEAPLILTVTDPNGEYHRIIVDEERLMFEPSDKAGAARR
jgi:hypothetical protein